MDFLHSISLEKGYAGDICRTIGSRASAAAFLFAPCSFK